MEKRIFVAAGAGKVPHGDECLAVQCVLFLQFDGAYDFAAGTKY
jgi:hypothetical protein